MSIEYYPLKITQKKKEAKDTFSFYLSACDEHKHLFYFQPAQFLTFRFDIEDKRFFRSYSIASSSLDEDAMRITLKKVEGGVVSNYMIDHLNEGDTILSQSPTGNFYRLPDHLDTNEYILFGAGVGVTPLYSILRTVLGSSEQDKVLLIYSCRNNDEIIYKEELEQLLGKYKDRFKMELISSQEQGRLDEEKLNTIFSKRNSSLEQSLFYLCGPKEYMKFIRNFLENKKVASKLIRTEDFQVVPIRGPKPDEDSVLFEAQPFQEGEPQKLKAHIYEEEVEIPLDKETSLLEQLLEAGHNPPFSCTSGSCLTCMAKLKEGKVFQINEGILDEENIKALELLTCQCYPLSEKVVISYDDL